MTAQPTVLIVDDEPITLEILAGHLSREGYEIAFATSGNDALNKLDTVKPDVILLDIMMPDLDGYEVCQRVKANKQWQHIPIILVTALSSKQDLARGLEAGADDFIHKPVHTLELRARVRSLLRVKKQYDALQATLSLREDMAHMIVHDMRTPLNVIAGYCDWMLTRETTLPENVEDLKKISFQTQHLNGFLNDLLILAKMEADQLILNRQMVNIDGIIETIKESHSVTAISKKVDLNIDFPESSQQVSLDASLFQRALDNLISNALKFSPDSATVTIQVEYPGKTNKNSSPYTLCIKVIDQGPGVAQKYRDRVFEKFEVAPVQQADLSQIGLGLTFCKMVVEAHNGYISVEDNQPTGSIFKVEI